MPLVALVVALAAVGGVMAGSAETWPRIWTSTGALTIHRVQFSKHFPPGCERSSGRTPGDSIDQGFSIPGYGRVELSEKTCNTVLDGYRILLVWLSGRGDRGGGGMLRKRTNDRLFAAAGKAYVRGSDGRRVGPYEVSTIQGAGTRFAMYLAFGPRARSRNFKLYWPANPPVALGK